jgi:hypothetical protein
MADFCMSEPTNGTEILHAPKAPTERRWWWRLAAGKCAGKMFAAGANSLITTLNGVAWSSFTGSQQFVAMLTMGVAMWQVMDAFLNNSLKELSEADKTQIANETSVTT